jgi:hypothetical protein
MADFFESDPYIRVGMRGNEGAFTTLLEVTSFLYDFNLLYEIDRLAIDPVYESFRFSSNVYYRTGRPLQNSDRLHVESLKLGSPIELTTLIVAVPAAATALWVTLQSASLISNWSLNRRKLRAEVEKIEFENAERKLLPPANEGSNLLGAKVHPDSDTPLLELLENPEAIERLLESREANRIHHRVVQRLRRSTIRISDVEVEVIERLHRDHEDQ